MWVSCLHGCCLVLRRNDCVKLMLFLEIIFPIFEYIYIYQNWRRITVSDYAIIKSLSDISYLIEYKKTVFHIIL